MIRAVVEAGVRDLGENRAQELLAKRAELASCDPVWHFIGRLQRNKVKMLAPYVARWQSVDRVELGREIARHAPGARVLIEVNTAGEEQKGGCAPHEVGAVRAALADLGLDVEGLMTVPEHGPDPRPAFERLAGLAKGLGLRDLSMGMSGDYETAVECGATIVRVGTAIFGPRRPRPRLRE